MNAEIRELKVEGFLPDGIVGFFPNLSKFYSTAVFLVYPLTYISTKPSTAVLLRSKKSSCAGLGSNSLAS